MTKQRLTILHTESSTGWGGQEIRIFQESLSFVKAGYRIVIACRPGSGIAREASGAGIPVETIRMRNAGDPIAIIQLLNVIRRQRIDIIHTHSSKDSWLAGMAGRISGVPVVRSRHLSTPVKKTRLASFVYSHLCDIIITSGRHIKDALISRNGINPEKIVSIPAGVDDSKFHAGISGDKVRAELGLNGSYPVVGVVAILRHWKGHRFVLEAAPRVLAEYPGAKFLIAGNGPQWDNLNRQVHELGIEKNVIMTGFRSDVPEIMAALDMFILPSVASEATSQVIPQALAVGKPVIATTTGGLPEIIEHEVTGLLVPPGDPAAIAEAIIRMARDRDKAREMALKGQAMILSRFTFGEMVARTGEIYRKLLNGRKTG